MKPAPVRCARALHQFEHRHGDCLRRASNAARPVGMSAHREPQTERACGRARLLRYGCRGGIYREALDRLDAQMTAMNPAPANLDVARQHAKHPAQQSTCPAATRSPRGRTSSLRPRLLAMKVLEHDRDVKAFIVTVAAGLTAARDAWRRGTLDRTSKSMLSHSRRRICPELGPEGHP